MTYRERIEDLAARAEREREAYERESRSDSDAPEEERALRYLREGAGPAVALYLEAHTGGDHHRFAPEELDALRGAMNDFLALYVRSHGVAYEPEFAVREAAELLVETESIRDVAVMLTGVPESARPGDSGRVVAGE